MEKFELAFYQLKDVAQSWYKVCQDSRALDGGPLTWDVFKIYFLGRFFTREMNETKVHKFINLKQDSILHRDYSLRFVRLHSPERPHCRKFGILHGGECMVDSNSC